MGIRRKYGRFARKLTQLLFRNASDTRHSGQIHHANFSAWQSAAHIRAECACEDAAGDALVIDQADDAVSTVSRDLNRFGNQSDIAMDAKQFIALAQALSLRIDQQKQGSARILPHYLQDVLRHGQTDFNTQCGVMNRTDHGKRLSAAAPGTGQQIAILHDVVTFGEQA